MEMRAIAAALQAVTASRMHSPQLFQKHYVLEQLVRTAVVNSVGSAACLRC
jgi:hypothetical protein